MANCNDSPKPNHQETITLYQYMSWENAEKVFTNWELKATLPHRTNDPFELKPSGNDTTVYKQSRAKSCEQAFLCFSRINSSAALWGHYGDSHRGVCLEFTFPLSLVERRNDIIHHAWIDTQQMFHGFLLQVQYSDKRYNTNQAPLYNMSFPGVDEEFNASFLGLASTKDISWQFEQEYRIMIGIEEASRLANDMVFYNHPMHYLTGVYLGIRCKNNVYYTKQFITCALQDKRSNLLSEREEDHERVFIRQMVSTKTTFAVTPTKLYQEYLFLKRLENDSLIQLYNEAASTS